MKELQLRIHTAYAFLKRNRFETKILICECIRIEPKKRSLISKKRKIGNNIKFLRSKFKVEKFQIENCFLVNSIHFQLGNKQLNEKEDFVYSFEAAMTLT